MAMAALKPNNTPRLRLLSVANIVTWTLALVMWSYLGDIRGFTDVTTALSSPLASASSSFEVSGVLRRHLLGSSRKKTADSAATLVERRAAAELAYRSGAPAQSASTRCLRTFQLGEDIVLQKNTAGGGDGSDPGASGRKSRWVRRNSRSLSYSHMPNVDKLANGTLIVTWQAAADVEGAMDQRIYFALATDTYGTEWGVPRRLPVPATGALWSPILHRSDVDGRVWLFYAESRDCMRPSHGRFPPRWVPGGDIKVTTTLTGDRWTAPRLILSMDEGGGIPKVLANKPIKTSTNTWVLPFWREVPRNAKPVEGAKSKCTAPVGAGSLGGVNSAGATLSGGAGGSGNSAVKGSAGVLVSTDNGAHWNVHGALTHPLTWLIENTVAERRDRSLLMLFRTWAGQIFEAKSRDGGKSWTTPSPTGMPNPDSKIAMIHLDGGGSEDALALAFNDHQKYHEDGFTRFRTNLRIAISQDGGSTWVRVAQMDEFRAPGWNYHYPTLIQVDCKLLVVYSRTFVESDEEGAGAADDQHESGIRIGYVDLDKL